MVDCLLTILVNQICRLFSTHQTPDSIITPEDSAKQLMISPLFTWISMIGLLREVNVFYVSPAHSEILILPMEYLLGRKLL